ncbi:putative ABC transport system ATP-binding protein [Oceanospirillum multiglobuliferum]|uniref:Methionine ABC transporter ATP-binding protein n=1 Tax=Oceanospirillum multiglobuliferum TaxID=64969 RepID=A0A1T4RS17_9GAMM|nr:ABC transporter ATP-binding protein [Oceanospirillum multiglobuliferum]OPX54709.1 methionine ABC transporter ATP-binding protein [Oceanospirillum multiglobuliferum]SKA18733.1 putative ABC transport system ATP-binding protein [Oceanospirillum multiglobuliferum]
MIELQNVSFTWPSQTEPTLKIESLTIAAGEKVFIHGPSGCGKSTLLSLLAGVMVPQQGEILIDHQALQSLSAGQRDHFRADNIGLVFQQFNLLPYLSVLDNVTLPCQFSKQRKLRLQHAGTSPKDAAQQLLRHLDLSESLWQKPITQLSIGQQQRVAVARALIGSPPVIIADEPTSALDKQSRDQFLALLTAEVDNSQSSLIFVSHDDELQKHFSRMIRLPELNQAVLRHEA